jgi:hypothetical protein
MVPRLAVIAALLLAALPARADEPAPLPSPDPPSSTPAGEQAAPSPAPAPAPSVDPLAAPRGAVVVAVGEGAAPHARELARLVYKKKKLRPRIDDAAAQVLSGGQPPDGRADLAQHRALIQALAEAGDDDIRRRLAGSLARDLGARLLVMVRVIDGEPSARVVRMPEEKFLPVTLTPKALAPGADAAPSWDWAEAAAMLEELVGGRAPGPRAKAKKGHGKKGKKKGRKGQPVPMPSDAKDDDDGNLLTSPWFWGGLGLVVTVGVTVLVLSQTALNEPDSITIEGRVAP